MLLQEVEPIVEPLASTLQLLGAGGFGAIIGWYVYYINRYRKGDVAFSDLTTVIGIIGGGGIISLFPPSTDLFGAYGIGLFCGFFGYYLVLVLSVQISNNFGVDWFLDGRRKKLAKDEMIPGEVRQTVGAMSSTGGEDELD
ncbi:MAG: hypothetical protein OT477_21450 [Chloroflexi bacterium]|nr:hypothetical protein [Chloroflexota bacterium]